MQPCSFQVSSIFDGSLITNIEVSSKSLGEHHRSAIMTVSLTLTLFVAVPTTYYAFFTAIEIACTAIIVGYAWKWRSPEDSPINATLAQGR
jgi:hypothetical protein